MKIFTPFITRFLFFFICCLTTVAIVAQNTDFQYKKDSLKKVITATKGTEKLDAYGQLRNIYFAEFMQDKSKIDQLIAFYKEYEAEAVRQKNISKQGDIKNYILTAYQNSYNHEKVIELTPEYLSFMAKHELWPEYYDTYSILIRAYLRSNATQNAIKKAQEMYDDAKLRNHKDGISLALFQMGNIYFQMDRLEEAEEYMTEAIELLKTNDQFIYHALNAYQDLIDVLILLFKTDEAFARVQEYEKLLDLYYKNTCNEQKDFSSLWRIYRRLYFTAGDYDKAELYCEKLSGGNDPNRNYDNYKILAQIYTLRDQYNEALELIEKMIEIKKDDIYYLSECLDLKVWTLCHKNDMEDIYVMFLDINEMHSTLFDMEYNAQLDELRTQYEVDKHIAEKIRNRNYFLFALGGCALLLIALAIWIYLNRKITKKNRTLAQQIKELTTLQEAQDNELLAKTTFIPEEERTEVVDDELCPQSRLDKLCLTIRDLILKDKIYRNPAITQELVIETMGTNRRIFSEAFEYCFKMQFKDYINFLRMKDAIILLEQSDLSIEEIADTAGFGTVRTFQRQFNAKYNMSPKEYRRVMDE